MTIISITPIKKGEPIQDNYGPIFTTMSKNVRKEKLAGRYWFNCNCIACTEDWPALSILPNEPEGCTPKVLKQLQKLESSTFYKAVDLMDAGKPRLAIQLLTSYIEDCTALLKKSVKDWKMPYKTILLAQEAMKLCYACTGSTHILKPK